MDGTNHPCKERLQEPEVSIPKASHSGLLVAVIGNLAAILSNLVLLRHDFGEAIRPMDLPQFWLAIGIATFLGAFPWGLIAFRSGEQPICFHGFLAMILSMTAIPFAFLGFLLMTAQMRLQLNL